MSRILFVFFIAFSLSASAQYDSTKILQPINGYGFIWKNGQFQGSVRMPYGLPALAVKDSGCISFYNAKMWQFDGYTWTVLSSGGSGGGSGLDSAAFHHLQQAADLSYATWNRPDGTKDTLIIVADGLVPGGTSTLQQAFDESIVSNDYPLINAHGNNFNIDSIGTLTMAARSSTSSTSINLNPDTIRISQMLAGGGQQNLQFSFRAVSDGETKFIPLSVNGIYADASGNIDVAAISTPGLQAVTDIGSVTNHGINIQTSDFNGLSVTASSIGIYAIGGTYPLFAVNNSPDSNDIVTGFAMQRAGIGSVGYGIQMIVDLNNASGASSQVSGFATSWKDLTPGNELPQWDLVLSNPNAGHNLRSAISVDGLGAFVLPNGLPNYADNSAAITGGLITGQFYRNGDIIQIVH